MVTELQLAVWSAAGVLFFIIAGISLYNRRELVKLIQLLFGHEKDDTGGGVLEEQESLFEKVDRIEEQMNQQHQQVLLEIRREQNSNDRD